MAVGPYRLVVPVGGAELVRFPIRYLAQVGSTQLCPDERCTQELGLAEIGPAEVGIDKGGINQGGPGKVSAFEIRPDQVDSAEIGPAEVGPAEVHTAEIRAFKGNPTQVRYDIGIVLPPRIPCGYAFSQCHDLLAICHN